MSAQNNIPLTLIDHMRANRSVFAEIKPTLPKKKIKSRVHQGVNAKLYAEDPSLIRTVAFMCRLKQQFKSGVLIKYRGGKERLANRMGCTRDTLCRHIKIMLSRGWCTEANDNIQILSLKRIAEMEGFTMRQVKAVLSEDNTAAMVHEIHKQHLVRIERQQNRGRAKGDRFSNCPKESEIYWCAKAAEEMLLSSKKMGSKFGRSRSWARLFTRILRRRGEVFVKYNFVVLGEYFSPAQAKALQDACNRKVFVRGGNLVVQTANSFILEFKKQLFLELDAYNKQIGVKTFNDCIKHLTNEQKWKLALDKSNDISRYDLPLSKTA